MSEKRAWDIQPRKNSGKIQSPAPQAPATPRRIQQPFARPIPRPVQNLRRPNPQPVTRRPSPAAPERTAPPVIRREKIPQGREREPLRKARRRKRRRALTFFIILLLFIAAGILTCLWLPAFRIREVDAAGPDQAGMQTIAMNDLTGTYKYVLPKNSIFFFPENDVRSKILAQYPDIAAVSISRESFDAIALDAIPRESAFLWCGTTFTLGQSTPAPFINTATSSASTISTTSTTTTPTQNIAQHCYDADSQGFVFQIDTQTASSTSDTLRVFGPLAGNANNASELIGQTVAGATYIPNALEFVKGIKELNVSVIALVLRGDEADLYTQAGTRITYVLGQEQDALELAQSAFPSLNLNDGSLEYVDLRFAGKVYFKKNGASLAGASATSTYSASVSCYLSGNCQIH